LVPIVRDDGRCLLKLHVHRSDKIFLFVAQQGHHSLNFVCQVPGTCLPVGVQLRGNIFYLKNNFGLITTLSVKGDI